MSNIFNEFYCGNLSYAGGGTAYTVRYEGQRPARTAEASETRCLLFRTDLRYKRRSQRVLLSFDDLPSFQSTDLSAAPAGSLSFLFVSRFP